MEQISEDKLANIIDNVRAENYELVFKSIDNGDLDGDAIEYSFILNYIKRLSGDEIDNFHFSILKIKRDPRIKSNSNSMRNFRKVLEHLLLEIPRTVDYNKINAQLSQNDKLNRDTRVYIRQIRENMKSHEEKMEKMQGEFISILSIFSAVIIAFFGGINLLGSALSNINGTNKYRLIIVLLVIGLIMFNVIYMLLYFVSRITDKNIGVKRKEKKCKRCNEKLRIGCLATKYPIVFYYNLFSGVLIVFTTVIYYVDHYNINSYIIEKLNLSYRPEMVIVVAMILNLILILILIVCYLVFKEKFKNIFIPKCDEKSKSEEDGIHDIFRM